VGASLATGIVWLFLGLTGTALYVTTLITRPVVLGIILGLGFGFMIEGAKMMAQNWWIGGAALLGTSLLLTNRILPAMFMLLLFGAAYGALSDPTLVAALREVHMELHLPRFALSSLTLNDILIGTVFLALPQVPLTLGNAVIASSEENNRLFPNRPVNESKISTSTGLMNLLSASVGGVPKCHGAGGMAGHVQFGARTGGALVIREATRERWLWRSAPSPTSGKWSARQQRGSDQPSTLSTRRWACTHLMCSMTWTNRDRLWSPRWTGSLRTWRGVLAAMINRRSLCRGPRTTRFSSSDREPSPSADNILLT
jgi:hypothetical protein